MGSITSKMPLFVWDHLDDRYDFAQLAQNWQTVAFHDHTPGRGVPIPPGALAPGAVSATTFDTSVLSYVSQHSGFTTQIPPSGTYNASSGDLVLAGATGPATATVQLPTPTQGGRVGVVADGLVTATNPVTITATGGAHIFGLGVFNVTSIVLGTIGANVLLHCDGTNWWIYAGQQDTGWINLSLTSPWITGSAVTAFTGNPAVPLQLRMVGDHVTWKGQAYTSTGTSANTILTIPAAYRPNMNGGSQITWLTPNIGATNNPVLINQGTGLVFLNTVSPGYNPDFTGFNYSTIS